MTDDTAASAPPGRPVRLVPTPPGFWMALLGGGLAALAPLFGFLAGSMAGAPEGDVMLSPLYWGLFGGVLLGGVGVLMAMAGGWRLWTHLHRASTDEDTP